MTTTRCIALLRGINVGGKNLIKMADLKACFEGMGFTSVVTYIQSGNVLFTTSHKNLTKLESHIEKTLSEQFSYNSRIVLLTEQQLQKIVTAAPRGFGSNSAVYRYDVLFLKQPLTAKEAVKHLKLRERVDEVFIGDGVLYFQRFNERLTQSYLSKVVMLPIYQQMTIRNWNTTTKLFQLAEPKLSS